MSLLGEDEPAAPARNGAAGRSAFGSAEQTSLVILATAAVICGLYFFRGALTQFALAGVLWLGVNGLANWIQGRLKVDRWIALTIGGVVVVGFAGLIGVLLARNVAEMASEFPEYQRRLDKLVQQIHHGVGLPPPAPSIGQLLQRIDAESLLAETAGTLQGATADALFILIYLGFIFGAAATMPKKLDRMFSTPKARERARRVISRIRASMESYLWTQTILSLVISGLTFVTLTALGLDNALFWSLFIFFLNYIPTVGSILATALPTLVAVVQFDELWRVAAVAGGTGLWQFAIGNFLQPRVMGDSLNLSALVVLLALAIWGLIWGIAGAFLSAPITVAIMIILAQFPNTRWIAILLSADGRPERTNDRTRKRANGVKP